MNKNQIAKLNLSELAEQLQNGQLTSVELVQAYIERINELDSKTMAFLAVNAEEALREAAASDERRKSGNSLSAFDGIPVGIKDCISTKNDRLSCASKLLENVVSPYDSTAVARLRQMGFIPLGRLNMDEFAMGSSCENSAFKRTANPWDTERVPGGSSGGSASAVAARLVPAALGSDTGGSIRQPAAFCGIVGVKPTYGRVSRYGLVAFASSLDQIGPMTTCVDDAALLLESIAGADKQDSTSLPGDLAGLAEAVKNIDPSYLKGKRIGLPKEYLSSFSSPEMTKVFNDCVETLRQAGAETVEVSLPHTSYAVAVYYIIATAEASANLARFDGIRYGVRQNAGDLIETYFKTRGAGFGDEVKRRILLGTYVLSSGYYDAYYLRAQKVRTLIRRDFEDAFNSCDLILTPVTPAPAFKFGEKGNPLEMYLSDIFTIALNLSGNCGVSVPAGKVNALPVGVQFIAPAMAEKELLMAAKAYETLRPDQEWFPPNF